MLRVKTCQFSELNNGGIAVILCYLSRSIWYRTNCGGVFVQIFCTVCHENVESCSKLFDC